VRPALRDAVTVEIALWFHDAIYWPWSGANELRSADWAQRFLQSLGWEAARAAQVRQLVLDTRHCAQPASCDGALLVDIDLAILGVDRPAYLRFEHDVRAEYRWVWWPRYCAGRAALLRGFLERPRIYSSAEFRSREAAARANLAHAIEALDARRAPA
jgi:predicted metal-dependent HD superfamily phosphohydrolase